MKSEISTLLASLIQRPFACHAPTELLFFVLASSASDIHRLAGEGRAGLAGEPQHQP